MIDSLLAARAKAVPLITTLAREGCELPADGLTGGYGVVTLHRPANVDEPSALRECLDILRRAGERLPLVWPVHPRTRARIDRLGSSAALDASRAICLPPQGYLEMVGMMENAKLVITDSGGVQEETTSLGVPCLTLRANTERPITVEQGTNTLVPRDANAVLALVDEILATGGKRGRAPECWDGHAAERIAADLAEWLREHAAKRVSEVTT